MAQVKYRRQAADSIPKIRHLLNEGGVIVSIGLALFLFLSLCSYSLSDPGWSRTGIDSVVHNYGGYLGSWFADVIFALVGYSAYLLPLLVIYVALMALFNWGRAPERREVIGLRWLGATLLWLALGGWLALHTTSDSLPCGAGGILGSLLVEILLPCCNVGGANVLLLMAILLGLTWVSKLSWGVVILRVGTFALWLLDLIGDGIGRLIQNPKESRESSRVRSVSPEEKSSAQFETSNSPIVVVSPAAVKPSAREQEERQINLLNVHDDHPLPPLELLDPEEQVAGREQTAKALELMSHNVELKLHDFGISVKVMAVHPGPVVTRFELQLAAGTKASRITALSKDLARSLAVVSVRVVEVIPGKSVIGLELPNQHRELVRLRAILNSEQFERSHAPLALALGKDIAGYPVVVDLSKMPHLLVAGTTGSGKSVCLNALLLSLIYKYTPTEVRLILIDPKMLELSVYSEIPHLLTPVVTDMKEAVSAFRWCVAEMERRYKLMSALGVRNLAGYNQKILDAEKIGEALANPLYTDENGSEAKTLTVLPYLVVLADEYADMMMVVGKKVEELIARIAQKARAAGVHLILATQRPSVDVITGLIKANIPTRIAFQVSSKIDSRTILDQGGAEQLLGCGDMLYLPPGSGLPIRVHGAFVADEEVHRVVNFLRAHGTSQYQPEILALDSEMTDNNSSEVVDAERDPLYDKAVEILLTTRRASVSNLQRHLRIGYNRAASIMDAMERAGLVSAPEVNGNREILVSGGDN